jgi:hypothetical protein
LPPPRGKSSKECQMICISSQRFINRDIVAEKKQMLIEDKVDCVEVPVYKIGKLFDDEGDDREYCIVTDKHHTRTAAIELGIPISYVITQERSSERSIEYVLEEQYMDSCYYDIETGQDIW